MLDSLQYLRAIASIMVVCYHLNVQLERMGYNGWWPGSLASGVDLFFIISGFLMLVTTDQKAGYTLSFYRKRLVRIVPLYWIITSLFVFLMIFAPATVQSGRPETWHIIASYLFLPAQHPVFPTIEPVVIPGWTLNYEMFFYFVWGFILLLPNGLRASAISVLFAGLVLLGALFPPSNVMMTFYTSTIIIEFIFGVMVGVWYIKGRPVPTFAGWGLLIAGFAAMLSLNEVTSQSRFLLWGIPAALIVIGALILEKAGAVRKYPFFTLLGDASYSIYIVHGIALSAAGQIWRRLGLVDLPGGLLLFAVCATVASVAAGVVVHFTIERPLLRLMTRKTPRVAASLP
ncbi:acyltransferase [Aquabacter sp. CN5-332]|uniref:acyltransferase family protein n=1 Tax=Aquabacter sp. CN5-332 TaxID=3156608 RepID=UPI0032B4B583